MECRCQWSVSLNADGPELEIVVTHDTVICREETEEPDGARECRRIDQDGREGQVQNHGGFHWDPLDC